MLILTTPNGKYKIAISAESIVLLEGGLEDTLVVCAAGGAVVRHKVEESTVEIAKLVSAWMRVHKAKVNT